MANPTHEYRRIMVKGEGYEQVEVEVDENMTLYFGFEAVEGLDFVRRVLAFTRKEALELAYAIPLNYGEIS